MTSDVCDAVAAALVSFSQAKAAIEQTFAVRSAAEIVTAVLQGHTARQGNCSNGLEYFVHGVGYTVVVASGGQVHFDSDDEDIGDVFSAYDIWAFLETSGCQPLPAISEIRDVLRKMHLERTLLRYGNRFGIPAAE